MKSFTLIYEFTVISILLALFGTSDANGRSIRWEESDIIDSFPAQPLRLRYEKLHRQIWISNLHNDISSAMDATYLVINSDKPDSLRVYQADAFLWLAEELVREGNHLTAEKCIREAEYETEIYRKNHPTEYSLNKLEALIAFQKARVETKLTRYDNAISEYEKALKIKNSGLSRSGMVGALANLYLHKDKDTIAEQYFLESINANDEPNSSIAATEYIQFLLDHERFDEAKRYVVRDYPRLKGLEAEQGLYAARYRYYMLTGDSLHAMENLAIAYDLQDSIVYEQTGTVLQDFAMRMINLNQQKNQKENMTIFRIGVFALIILLLFTVFWLWRKKTQHRFYTDINQPVSFDSPSPQDSEEEPSIEKVMNAEAESSALKEIRKIANGHGQEVESQMEAIKQLLRECELNDKSRDEFMTHFAELYPDFLNRLYTVGPGLTKAEVRMACMCFLNMTTKDISLLTHRSANTINSIKRTLRKKLNITGGTESYFHHLSIAPPEEMENISHHQH